MDRHSSHEVPDLLPLHMYDQNRAKIDASLKWLINKAYTSQVPKELVDPLPKSKDDTKTTVLINTGLLKQLANGLLYCLAVQNTFPHWNLSWKSHWSIIQALSKKSVYVVDEDDSMITQQDLVQTRPFNIRAHLALVDAMMRCHVMETVAVDKVVQAVKLVALINASRDLPFDVEDALLLWLNKVSEAAVNQAPSPQNHRARFPMQQLSRVPPVIDDLLKDIVDGQSLALLINFYTPTLLSLDDVSLQSGPGAPLSIADSMANLELVRSWCLAHLPTHALHLTTEDFLYSPDALKPNLLAFLADMFHHLISEPMDGVRRISQPLHQKLHTSPPMTGMSVVSMRPKQSATSPSVNAHTFGPPSFTGSGYGENSGISPIKTPQRAHSTVEEVHNRRGYSGERRGYSGERTSPVIAEDTHHSSYRDLRAHTPTAGYGASTPSDDGSSVGSIERPRPRSRRGSDEYSSLKELRKSRSLHSLEDKELIRQSILNWETKNRQPESDSDVPEEPDAEEAQNKSSANNFLPNSSAAAGHGLSTPQPHASWSRSTVTGHHNGSINHTLTGVDRTGNGDEGLLSARLLMNGGGSSGLSGTVTGSGVREGERPSVSASITSGLSEVSLPVGESVSASYAEGIRDMSVDSSILESVEKEKLGEGGNYTPFGHFAQGSMHLDTPYTIVKGISTGAAESASARSSLTQVTPRYPPLGMTSSSSALDQKRGDIALLESIGSPRSVASVARSFVIEGTHTPESARAAGLPVVPPEVMSQRQAKVEQNNNSLSGVRRREANAEDEDVFPVHVVQHRDSGTASNSHSSSLSNQMKQRPHQEPNTAGPRSAWQTPPPSSLKNTYLGARDGKSTGDLTLSSSHKVTKLRGSTTSWEENARRGLSATPRGLSTSMYSSSSTRNVSRGLGDGSSSGGAMLPISKELADVKLQLKQNRTAMRKERETNERAKKIEKEQVSREAFKKVVGAAGPSTPLGGDGSKRGTKKSPSSPVRRSESLHGLAGQRARPSVQQRIVGNQLGFSRSDIRMSIENLASKWQKEGEDLGRARSYTSLTAAVAGSSRVSGPGVQQHTSVTSHDRPISVSSSSTSSDGGMIATISEAVDHQKVTLPAVPSTEAVQTEEDNEAGSFESLVADERENDISDGVEGAEGQSLDELSESLNELQGEINRLSTQQEQIRALTLKAASSSGGDSGSPRLLNSQTKKTKMSSSVSESLQQLNSSGKRADVTKSQTGGNSGGARSSLTRSSSGLLRSSQLASVYGSNSQLSQHLQPNGASPTLPGRRSLTGGQSLLSSRGVSASSPNVSLGLRPGLGQRGGQGDVGRAALAGGNLVTTTTDVGGSGDKLGHPKPSVRSSSQFRHASPLAEERTPTDDDEETTPTTGAPLHQSLSQSTLSIGENGPTPTRPKRATWDMTTPRGGEVVNINAGPDTPGIGFTVVDEEEAAEIEEQRRKKIIRMQTRRREELERKREEREEALAKKRDEQRERLAAEERQKVEEKDRRERLLSTHQKRKEQEELPPELRAGSTAGVQLRTGRSARGHTHRASTGLMLDMRKSDFIDGLSNFGDLTQRRPASPSDFSSMGMLTGRSKTASIVSGAGGQGDGTVILEEYSGPKLYVKPSSKSKSNRNLIINAISHCCLAGVVNEENKRRTLEDLETYEAKNFLILFRDGHQQFRAIYAYFPETDEVIKVTGQGPKVIANKMIDRFYKYNSGARTFIEVTSTKHLSVSIDAVTIHNALWGKKVPRRQAPV